LFIQGTVDTQNLVLQMIEEEQEERLANISECTTKSDVEVVGISVAPDPTNIENDCFIIEELNFVPVMQLNNFAMQLQQGTNLVVVYPMVYEPVH
jgi:hypothetical protein